MRTFKFAHKKGIEAIIFYNYSKDALILLNRTFICYTPVGDILKSKSWEEIKNVPSKRHLSTHKNK